MKHNDSCLGWGKKKIPTNPFFSHTCNSKHNIFFLPKGRLLYAYSVLMEFPGQELDLSMPEGREVKESPRPEGHLWVQTGTKGERSPPTENAFLNLRGAFVIGVSPASVCLYVRL